MDSPYPSTANDLFALLIKVKMKCTGKLWFSDIALVLTQINMFLQKHKLKTTERTAEWGDTWRRTPGKEGLTHL